MSNKANGHPENSGNVTITSEAAPIFTNKSITINTIDEASDVSMDAYNYVLERSRHTNGTMTMISTPRGTSIWDWGENPQKLRRTTLTNKMLNDPEQYPLAEALYGKET